MDICTAGQYAVSVWFYAAFSRLHAFSHESAHEILPGTCIIQPLTILVVVCDVELCFCQFPCGILGQVWYFIVSIPDLCRLSYLQ